jgi:hypothetical protein
VYSTLINLTEPTIMKQMEITTTLFWFSISVVITGMVVLVVFNCFIYTTYSNGSIG